MGHILFIILHLLALAFGIVGLVITIPLHIIYTAASQPKGTRPDGKRQTGGWFGPLIDDIIISAKMTNCPFCKAKIDKKASKCPYCQEWVVVDTLEEADILEEYNEIEQKNRPRKK